MGLLDWPAILLNPLQSGLNYLLPLSLCLILWAVLLSALSMKFYQRFSRQSELDRIKPLRLSASRELAAYDGPFVGLFPLIRRNLLLSGRQIHLTLGPSLLASIPVLAILPWLSNTFAYSLPAPGEYVEIDVETFTPYSMYWDETSGARSLGATRWELPWPTGDDTVSLYRRDTLVATLPLSAPSPVVHKRLWWNLLVGNPAGYLLDNSPAESIYLQLPERQYLPWGPAAARGWLALFLMSMLLSSFFFKRLWGIH